MSSGLFCILMPKRPPNLKAQRGRSSRNWTATTRQSRHQRGYGWEWEKLRARILDRDKHLCQPCLRNDRVTPATEVDHRLAKHLGGTDDDANLEAICNPCHKVKTAREGRARRG